MSSRITHTTIESKLYFTIQATKSAGHWSRDWEDALLNAACRLAQSDDGRWCWKCPRCDNIVALRDFKSAIASVQDGSICQACTWRARADDFDSSMQQQILESDFDSRNLDSERSVTLWHRDFRYMPHLTHDGVADLNPRAYDKALSKWSMAVRERDEFTCQTCGKVSPHVHAHHNVPLAEDPLLGLSLSNGVTLCDACHDELHST